MKSISDLIWSPEDGDDSDLRNDPSLQVDISCGYVSVRCFTGWSGGGCKDILAIALCAMVVA